MRTIHKYPFESDRTEFSTYVGAKPLCVQMQERRPCLWMEVDLTQAVEQRTAFIVGTGHYLEPGAVVYVGTLQDGPYVWHVYLDGAE